VNISFVGSNALAKELGAAGEGVVVTQVVPFPNDISIPLVAAYHTALKAIDPKAEPGFVSLEGYIVGRLVVAALDRIEGVPTRQALLSALSTGTYDLGGAKLAFSPTDNQGMDEVFLTVIRKDGSFRAVRSLSGRDAS
jgi:branched-chain amino acid transport system substrate-binding protein